MRRLSHSIVGSIPRVGIEPTIELFINIIISLLWHKDKSPALNSAKSGEQDTPSFFTLDSLAYSAMCGIQRIESKKKLNLFCVH